MTLLSRSSESLLSRPESPPPPAPWLETVLGLVPAAGERIHLARAGVSADLTEASSEHALLASVRVPDARQLDADAFIEATAAVYDHLRERFRGWTPARFWNHIPCIHDAAGEQIDRYMAFNLGRRAGLKRWLGPGAAFTTRIATATGIGHRGDDLIVHGLGWHGDVVHVENPRQRPAYRYSRRYGPAAPSFARATWLSGASPHSARMLAIGGTASIRGEETIAPDDLAAQVEETLTNLDSLVTAAGAAVNGSGLTALSQVRIFHVRPEDAPALRQHLAPAFPGATRIDFHRADVCRRELLIEIEGLVLPAAGPCT